MTTLPPWLTDEEIASLCDGLIQPAAQARFLRHMGLTVRFKPNGKPLIMRAEVEALGTPAAKPTQKRGPNRDALVATFARQA